ncbi:MAG: S1C family serine protease [Gemmataceae bacterium]
MVEKTEQSIVAIKIPSRRTEGRPSIGTGVIIDERGYIITNYHVIGGRSEVDVYLADKTKLTGYVVLRVPESDLAVLRIKVQSHLKALRFATASDLQKGEDVVAIGHPFGYEFTVTHGLVSNLNQTIKMPSGEVLEGLILTSAPINPGNSGGPLLNINGELIGINVALRQGAQGIAFAINADKVCDLLAKKLSALEISQIGHGLDCQETVIAEIGDRQRTIVRSVHRATPAGRAGLQKGDVIRSVNGYKVANKFDVERMMWGRRAGEEVKLQVVRGQDNMVVSLTLMDAQAYQQAFALPAENGTQHVSTEIARTETPATYSNTTTEPTTKSDHGITLAIHAEKAEATTNKAVDAVRTEPRATSISMFQVQSNELIQSVTEWARMTATTFQPIQVDSVKLPPEGMWKRLAVDQPPYLHIGAIQKDTLSLAG